MADAPGVAASLLEKIVAMFSTGDTSDAQQVFADDYVDHQGLRGETIRGIDGFRRVVGVARAPYTELDVRIVDWTTNDDKILARLRWRGIPASGGRPIERETFETLRVAEGRIVEHWGTRVAF